MSYKDVIAILGESEDPYGDNEFMILTYEGAAYETDFFSRLEITLVDGKVTDIDIRHW